MPLTLVRVATVLGVLIIVYFTLGPLGIRTMSPVSAEYDRAIAYAVVGVLAVLSAPRRPWIGALLVIAMAVGLEVAQRITADRHGHLLDVAQKMGGALLGIVIGFLIRRIANRYPPGN